MINNTHSIKRLSLIIITTLAPLIHYGQKNYFQQKVDNDIHVTLNDSLNELDGNIKITYTNNSPDTLKFIYFHLYPNAYSTDYSAYDLQAVENHTTQHYLSPKSEWGNIAGLDWKVVGQDSNWVSTNQIKTSQVDIVLLPLSQPLYPGKTIAITTPFKVKIPKTFSRLGHDGQSYQISQWFPKPAVYDNKGWHPMPYLDQGEFYSEFGNYNVFITLPDNYVCMATGNLLDEKENQWLDNLSKEPIKSGNIKTEPSSPNFKTLHFSEQNIHDFAWFASKNWNVQKDTFTYPDAPEKPIIVYAAFAPKNANNWSGAIENVKRTLAFYGSHVGEYPYKTVKVVEGALIAGDGMEYPTIAVMPNAQQLVVVHEVGHNWFYGILGSNERDHAWMDEGINSYYQNLQLGLKDNNKLDFSNLETSLSRFQYQQYMAAHTEMPIDTTSTVYPYMNYAADVYSKTPDYIAWLRDYMGADTFEMAMKQYYNSFKFKHVYPEDFVNTMKQFTSKDLSWFETDGLHSDKGVDFLIKNIKEDDGKTWVSLKNKTGFNGPAIYKLTGKSLNGDTVTLLRSSAPFTKIITDTFLNSSQIKWTAAEILNVTDYNKKNNLYNGSSHRFGLGTLAGLNNKPISKTWIFPSAGFNNLNGFMLGLMFHNVTIPENKFQYFLSPMYGFGSKTFGGTGYLSYATYPKSSSIQEIDYNMYLKSFGYNKYTPDAQDKLVTSYYKVAPEIMIRFKNTDARSPVNNYLSIKGYIIGEQGLNYNKSNDTLYLLDKGSYKTNVYGRVTFTHENNRTFNPFSYKLDGQIGSKFAKISAEANLKIDYFYKDKGINIRAFAGKMFVFSGNEYDASRYSLTSTYSSWNDYFYDETFLGRNRSTGLFSQQIANREGGMMLPTLLYSNQLGLSNNWLAAANVTFDLPINLPLKVYGAVSVFDDSYGLENEKHNSLYAAGIILNVTKYLTITAPLFYSTVYKDYTKSVYPTNRFSHTITFALNLDKIYWPRAQRELIPKY